MKFTEADKTGICYNCGERVGSNNLVANIFLRWPVCEPCNIELTIDCEDDY